MKMDEHEWTDPIDGLTYIAQTGQPGRLYRPEDRSAWDGYALAPALREILRLSARVKELEAVVRERGRGTPAPEEIDQEAFGALSPLDRFMAYREAAGWALQARAFEAENVELRSHLAELAYREELRSGLELP
jgi:hypothetical protein